MHKIISPLIVATFIATSCSAAPPLPRESDVFLNSIAGTAGVIGAPDYEFNIPADEYNRAWAATGLIKIMSNDGRGAKFATGVLVKKAQNDHEVYVLTAKHVIYNLDNGAIYGRKAAIGFDPSSKSYAYLKMNGLPEKLTDIENSNDFIMILVSQTDVEPMLVSHNTEVVKQLLLSKTPRFSVSTFLKEGNFHKVLQRDFSVFTKQFTKPDTNLMASDMDAIVGASGSPIFLRGDDGEIEVVGILTSISKQPDCKRYVELFCSNTITLVE